MISLPTFARAAAVAAWVCTLPAASWAAAVELVMVEQAGCFYCARWNEQIAPAYPKTDEGQFAPLRRVDLYDLPDDLAFTRRVVFTPTFVVVDADGTEVGRLEGYPGEHFFWPMLTRLLHDTVGFDADPAKTEQH